MRVVLDTVSQRFGDTVALREVSIEARDEEFLVLLGPSGCGKSTMLRVIAGLIEPTEGRVLLGDEDVTALGPGERDIAMVFQSYALYPHLTVRRNLGFGLRAAGHPKREVGAQVDAVARRLGLSELLERRPRQLSGGQRQRVALGRAMVRDPAVFLMDEPLSNLDAQLRTATRTELIELHAAMRATFVFVTHDQVEAMTMATRIVVLQDGRVEQVGTPAEIYDDPASAFVAGFIGAPPMNLVPVEVAAREGRVTAVGDGVRASLWDGSVPSRAALLGVRPERLVLAPADGGSGAPGDAGLSMQGTVIAIENLGSEEVAVCRVGERRVSLRGPRPLGLATGDAVTLRACAEHVALFDAESQRRLRWVDSPTVTARAPVAGAVAARG